MFRMQEFLLNSLQNAPDARLLLNGPQEIQKQNKNRLTTNFPQTIKRQVLDGILICFNTLCSRLIAPTEA